MTGEKAQQVFDDLAQFAKRLGPIQVIGRGNRVPVDVPIILLYTPKQVDDHIAVVMQKKREAAL